MRKPYVNPEIEVFVCEMQSSILNTSDGDFASGGWL